VQRNYQIHIPIHIFRAKKAGIIILNELGLDPGIDHMSAMKMIDHVKSEGGKVSNIMLMSSNTLTRR
jgi:saccharopine dehydrogenase-like NADP-dependent oxidoreductase